MTASYRSVRSAQRGFTLTELAVVFTIVALLLGGLMYTLSAQSEARNLADTQRRLEEARELLIGFALANGRLPCPARHASSTSHSQGRESFCSASSPASCAGSETTTVQTHGNCSNFYDGYLPAVAIGFTPVDASGFAIDPWGNRIRYAVAKKTANASGSTSCTTTGVPGFTSTSTLKTNGVGCVPDEFVVCASSSGVTTTGCGTALAVTNQNVAAAVVFSTGKNFNTAMDAATAAAAGRTDEAANLNGDGVFVYHTPRPASESNEFDDQMLWLPGGMLYGRLVAGGVLP